MLFSLCRRRIPVERCIIRFSTSTSTLKAKSSSTVMEKEILNHQTVGSLLTSAVEKYPYKEALRGYNEKKRYSYQEFYQASRDLATGFLDMGIEKGNTIALWMPNRTENYIIQVAAMILGARIAQIDTRLNSPKALHEILAETKARMFIYSGSMNEQRSLHLIRKAIPELDVETETFRPLRSKTLRNLEHVYSTDFDIDDLSDEQLENHYEKDDVYIPIIGLLETAYIGGYEPRLFKKATAKVEPDTPAVVIYSSEDNETPKKVAEYTHKEICVKSKQISKELSAKPDDSICITKLTEGFSLAPFAAFYSNSQVVLPSFDENHEYIEEAMKTEGCKITGRDIDNYQRL